MIHDTPKEEFITPILINLYFIIYKLDGVNHICIIMSRLSMDDCLKICDKEQKKKGRNS